MIVSEGVFGFAVSEYISTAGQGAGGVLIAKNFRKRIKVFLYNAKYESKFPFLLLNGKWNYSFHKRIKVSTYMLTVPMK